MGYLDNYFFGQSLLYAVAVYHLAVGIPSVLSLALTRKIAHSLYRLQIPEVVDPRYEYALKPLGFYALTIGFFCLLEAALGEGRHRALFFAGLAFLMFVRAWGRFFYKDLFTKAFGTSWGRSKLNVIFNIALGGLLGGIAYALY